MILYKTAKATDELKSDKRSLSIVQRRALLLADGIRDSDEIRHLLQRPDSAELLYLLMRQGYLSEDRSQRASLSGAAFRQHPSAASAETASTPPASAAGEAAAALDPAARQRIAAVIRHSSEAHLGLFARGILDELAHLPDAAALRGCISRWHLALLDSRSGRELAAELLTHVELLWQASALDPQSDKIEINRR